MSFLGPRLTAKTITAVTLVASVGTVCASDRYFSGVTLCDYKGSNDFVSRWYGETLESLGEPPIREFLRAGTSYRLLWIPSFHAPIMVRIVKTDDSAFVLVKRLKSSLEWNDEGRLIRQKVAYTKRVPLTAAQWEGLSSRINASHFWSMPTVDPKPPFEDGDNLLIEAIVGGKSHTVHRRRSSQAFRELCRYMLDLGIDMRHLWRDYHEK